MWRVRQAQPQTTVENAAGLATVRQRLIKDATRVIETAAGVRIAFATVFPRATSNYSRSRSRSLKPARQSSRGKANKKARDATCLKKLYAHLFSKLSCVKASLLTIFLVIIVNRVKMLINLLNLTIFSNNKSTKWSELRTFTANRLSLPVFKFHQRAIRCLDVVVAILALAILAPLILGIAIAIAASRTGPVLFKQERLGRGGSYFVCLKFRTMPIGADKILENLLSSCPKTRAEWEQNQKLLKDPRTSFIGRFLRKTSMDEIPQFINVLAGEMSIVGPRPIVAGEAERYGRYIEDYCSVRPGITGLWQVSGRNLTSYRRRIACDVVFSKSCSPATHIRIIAATIPVVLFGRGAY
jgi:exopolysaccharide production protein ExoY